MYCDGGGGAVREGALGPVRPAALPSGLTPAQLHKAYELPTKTAVPATVAVVDAFDYSSAYSDLTRYSTTFGLPVLPQCSQTVTASCFQKVNLGPPPTRR